MKRKIKLLKSAPVGGKWKKRGDTVDAPAAEAADLEAVGKAEYADKDTGKEPSSDTGRNAKK